MLEVKSWELEKLRKFITYSYEFQYTKQDPYYSVEYLFVIFYWIYIITVIPLIAGSKIAAVRLIAGDKTTDHSDVVGAVPSSFSA